MADVTIKHIDDMDSLGDGRFVRCRAELGVTSFGFQVLNLPPDDDNTPEHAHANMPAPYERANDGQEEVYFVLSGRAYLQVDGSEHELGPGTMARVGPEQVRHLVTHDEPAQLVVIGAMPGKPYTAPAFTEIGAEM